MSQLYRLLSAGHRASYRWGWAHTEKLPVPVVVVGNVVAGGAGKTPLVMALVAHLQAQGWRPGIVSRGHGRRGKDCREVQPDSLALDSGDEPLLLRQRCGVPVWVARRRAEAGRALLAAHPDVNLLVCDDGLQHHGLARDVNIAVFDDRGLGNGWLLPAGPLREAWRPERADLVLHTGQAPAFAGWRAERRLGEEALAPNGQRLPLAGLRGRRLMALAGIARPGAFFEMLAQQGLHLEQALALPDHDRLDGLALPEDPGLTVLCTEKDAVKLFPKHLDRGERLLAVPLQLRPEAGFWAALDERLAPLRPAHPLPSTHGHPTT